MAPSTKVERYLREWGVTVPIDVIATGVDVDRYSTVDPGRIESMRTSLALKPEERVLLFVGRLGREKNVELLLRSLWHSHLADIRLVIAGDGPHRSDLEALVDELDLRGRVSFLGYLQRDDAIAAYHLAHAFAFASTTETQGLVIGEAMAACLPVIAVEDHAVEDFVISGRTGLVVPGRSEDLAHAFDDLLGNEELRLQMAAASCERATHFSIQRQAERLEKHYLAAIENLKPRRRFVRLALPRRRKLTP